jgi:hypothetical protein
MASLTLTRVFGAGPALSRCDEPIASQPQPGNGGGQRPRRIARVPPRAEYYAATAQVTPHSQVIGDTGDLLRLTPLLSQQLQLPGQSAALEFLMQQHLERKCRRDRYRAP